MKTAIALGFVLALWLGIIAILLNKTLWEASRGQHGVLLVLVLIITAGVLIVYFERDKKQ